jgi:hypothetical protein
VVAVEPPEPKKVVYREEFKPAPLEIKGYIERASLESGVPYETLERIVWCESRYNQEAVNRTNKNGSTDWGLLQINSIHLPEAEKLGLDIINSAEDNTTFAIILLKRYGTKPWVCKG